MGDREESRLTEIITQLQAKKIVTATYFAEKHAVSVRTIYRDIRSWEESGTELTMMSNTSASPSFMIYLMRGVMAKALDKHLFGMKYFIETGKTVSADTYKEVYKGYKK